MHFSHRSDTPDTLYRHCQDTLKHSQDTQNTPIRFLRDIIQILEDVGPFSLLEKDGLRVGRGWFLQNNATLWLHLASAVGYWGEVRGLKSFA